MDPIAKTIVITGASGFLGRHLCAFFSHLGYQVRAVYRRSQAPLELQLLAQQGVELMNLDLSIAGSTDLACKGMDIVLHSAALAYDWGPYELFKKANVDITDSLLDSAQRAGCGNFIYISTAAVHGFGIHENTTEDGPFYPLRYPYPITKLIAEKRVLACNRPGFRAVAVRPCNVYGPGDVTSTYTMYEAILEGTFGYIGSGAAYTCPIYIDDLCEGVRLMVENDHLGGQVVLLSDGCKVRWRDYVQTMYHAVGSSRHPVSLPIPLAFTAAGVMGFGAKVLHTVKAPPLTRYRVEQAAHHYHFSHDKAKKLLGFEPKTFYEEGLGLTAEAFLRDRKKTGGP